MVYEINIYNGNNAMETNQNVRFGMTNLPQVLKIFILLLTEHVGRHMLVKQINTDIRKNKTKSSIRLSLTIHAFK